MIPRLKEILAKPDPALGYIQWRTALLVRLGAGSRWRPCRRPGKLATGAQRTGTFPERTAGNYALIGDLALTNMSLGDKAAALALAERAMAANPIEKDALTGPTPIEILARVAASMGEPDRAIAALQKLLSIPYHLAR